MQQQGIKTFKEFARYIGKPYRTIKNNMKVLRLCPEAKRIMRDSCHHEGLRKRLTRFQMESISIGSSSKEQVAFLRRLLE